jgi:hypothetical protein
MTCPQWTRTHHGWSLRAGAVEVELWCEDGITGPWEWYVYLRAGQHAPRWLTGDDEAPIACYVGAPTKRPQTAARHALAWVRRSLGPIAEVAFDEPTEPANRRSP